ncbi:TNF receptor-associated factor 2-like [Dendronephthya gigantea]|uniref:TNF receptor-associated factor 2-like n=1 Tax=Dendronephthya gigantea TaxID=151771 RepID=UPI00106D7B89|nr:TNF receptor-associated factor 2-like [Dendronephthya gigantea]
MATNGHSGHPMKWFKDQHAARHAYECAICLEVLKDPVQIRDCGHQFCAVCIASNLRINARCPSCRIEISEAMIFEDNAARRLIQQLDVNCCNEGCSWQGCLSSLLQDHQKNCTHGRDAVHQLDADKLEALVVKVSTLEQKLALQSLQHENEMRQMKEQHNQDLDQLRQEFNEILTVYTMRIMSAPQGNQQLLATSNFSNHQERVVTYTWRIRDFARKYHQAILQNVIGRLESEPFFSRDGYKMKLRLNLNQESIGYPGCMGIYLLLMKGDQDALLPWPFTKRFTFILVDQQNDPSQRQDIEESIVPRGERNFERPQGVENVGRGYENFVTHAILNTRGYIKNGTLFIMVVVDP